MRKFTTALAIAAAGLTVLVAGCGGGDEAAPAAKTGGGAGTTAALKMEDIKFDAAALKGTKGQLLTVNLTNAGALEHDFTIDKIEAAAKIDGKDAKSEKAAVHAVLKPKATGKLEMTPAAAGAFEYYCSVPGHKEAGMKGTLTVN